MSVRSPTGSKSAISEPGPLSSHKDARLLCRRRDMRHKHNTQLKTLKGSGGVVNEELSWTLRSFGLTTRARSAPTEDRVFFIEVLGRWTQHGWRDR